ncbi:MULTISPECIES: hypothetical protein [Rhodococcus]|jgi:hypothetical protein|uniref:Uncharacterized protein n=2 Tax=Nocardiaceae TaxID=85025 RepID=A0A652YVT8_NOCGL|nr:MULTISPECIES: hypothetical protein [Rhodococcus]KJF23346.1 hypothetical protein SZ00_00262 [Rhodococcus sp. AD45]MDV6268318.1 hypothetical protein [Rhodococcus globerulus]MDV8069727.1 hypothetical protein [Rhodococcus sp. IEGM 1366]PVX64119.1 hypothetical protein C8E04_1392 [Rhodococcus globerulus]
MGSQEEFSAVIKNLFPVLKDLLTAIGGGSLTPGTGSAAEK